MTEWLWCLRAPVVQAYAVRECDGFDLIDTSTDGQEDAILGALASVAGGDAQVFDLLVTHGHDDLDRPAVSGDRRRAVNHAD